MTENKTIITRFAPSPTGALHVGGARTALFNWAYARKHGGQFILRIEDTDQTRSSKESEEGIIRDLKWLGIDWDNEGEEPRQSRRLDRYNAAINKLTELGHTYEDDGAIRFKMPQTDITFCDEIRGDVTTPAGQIEDFIIKKSDGFPTYHLAVVADDEEMGVTHILRGQEHLSNTPKHIALQQALGYRRPTYAHFGLIFNPDGSKMSKRDKAKVARKAAKDHLATGGNRKKMIKELVEKSIWHVKLNESLVSETLVPATAEKINAFIDKKNDDLSIAYLIASYLEIDLPEINVSDFENAGYLSTALCNYLALLGWNPGNDLEKFDTQFLADHFDFDRVGKGDSKFDRTKLSSFNGDAIQTLDQSTLCDLIWEVNSTELLNSDMLQPQIENDPTTKKDDPKFILFCEAYQQRSKTLRDPIIQGEFLWNTNKEITFNPKAHKKVMDKNDGDGWAKLKELNEKLKELPDENFGEAAHDLIKSLAESQSINMGKFAQPLRFAISGSNVTPPIDATLDILGKEKTLERITFCLATQSSQ